MVALYIKSILSIFSPSSIHLIDLCSLYLSLSASSSLFFTVRLSRARKERWMRMFFPPSNCRENKVSPLVEWTRIIVSALIVMAHWQMPTYNAFKNVHIHRGKKKKKTATWSIVHVMLLLKASSHQPVVLAGMYTSSPLGLYGRFRFWNTYFQ